MPAIASPDGETDYGMIASGSSSVMALYGDLAIRYNGLRAWARCIIAEHNTGKTPAACAR